MPTRSSSASKKSRSRSRSSSAKKRNTKKEEPLTAVRASQLAADLKSGGAAGGRKSTATQKALPDRTWKFTPHKDTFDGTYEFGGWFGALMIMIISHFLVFYAFICIHQYGGEIVYPGHPKISGGGSGGGSSFFSNPLGESQKFASEMKKHFVATCVPSVRAFSIYLAFLVLEWALAAFLPGPVALGKPVPSENGYQHKYKCNAVYAWYIILSLVAGLYYFNIWKISEIAVEYGSYLTSAVIIADTASILVFAYGKFAGLQVRLSGNFLYDFFMGNILNPKLPCDVDFKMIAELRISWAYFFFITLSHAVFQYEQHGKVSSGMCMLLLGHFLYANACQKGEECVPACWDIYFEKFGWMLIFWNLAGVPVFYGVQGQFLVRVRPTMELPVYVWAPMVALLLFAYYIFDTAGSQKNRFRMMRDGAPDEILRRKTFPQLPWGFIEKPNTLVGTGADGKRHELFVDGWFKYARKINYTADSCMAFLWGASCGFGYFMPFFYWTFHFCMLLHRVTRDEHLMATKYGDMWDKYIQIVPYRFIPGVI